MRIKCFDRKYLDAFLYDGKNIYEIKKYCDQVTPIQTQLTFAQNSITHNCKDVFVPINTWIVFTPTLFQTEVLLFENNENFRNRFVEVFKRQ